MANTIELKDGKYLRLADIDYVDTKELWVRTKSGNSIKLTDSEEARWIAAQL